MNPFVADPEWGWWIVFYFFLGGIAAGAYFTATLIDLFGEPEDRGLARVGYRVAFPLVLVCGALLILDLYYPTRFWHMLFKSEMVGEALGQGWPWSGSGWRTMAGAPLLKYWSPMSVGSWALTLFGLCSGLSFLGTLGREGRVARVLNRGPFAVGLRVVGSLVGFFVASYTGALLTATNQPVWSDSVWVAPLFLTSAASTGIALMLLLARGRMPDVTRGKLERADLWALGLELASFAAFLASLGGLLWPVLQTGNGLLLVLGTLFVGLLIPLAIHLRIGIAGRGAATAAALFVLAGGFLMRSAILRVPRDLAAGPARVVRFSPEEGRPRGAGTGADVGNRPGVVEPRSKVFGGE